MIKNNLEQPENTEFNQLLGFPDSTSMMNIRKSIAKKLEQKSTEIRKEIINIISHARSGHIGGCFSACELLTVLFYYKLTLTKDNYHSATRDRFILSKGHSAPLLYTILMDKGIIPPQEFSSLRSLGSILPGHPRMDITPGIDMSTGSLGMGISAGCGMAMAAKLDGFNYHTYVLVGDGELQEGQIWEAVMTASHFHLNNLIVIIDRNKLQSNSPVKIIKNCGEIANQFQSFNWNVLQIEGHDILEIMNALDTAIMQKRRPTAIIANTCKGKGVSFMENNPIYHSRTVINESQQNALKELN